MCVVGLNVVDDTDRHETLSISNTQISSLALALVNRGLYCQNLTNGDCGIAVHFPFHNISLHLPTSTARATFITGNMQSVSFPVAGYRRSHLIVYLCWPLSDGGFLFPPQPPINTLRTCQTAWGQSRYFFQERYSDYKDGAVVRLCYIDSGNSFILKTCVFILGRGCVIALSGQVCGEWHLSEIKVHATQRVFQSSTVAQSRLMVINMSDRNAKIYSMETSFLLTKWD